MNKFNLKDIVFIMCDNKVYMLEISKIELKCERRIIYTDDFGVFECENFCFKTTDELLKSL